MKIRIEVDGQITEDQLIIKCKNLTTDIVAIEKAISELLIERKNISFYKNDVEYYIPLSEVLFFETNENSINAHSIEDIYEVKYKLYELEEILPQNFLRISKSTILNVEQIFSIERNITASSIVGFQKTHKKVYVSRHYYKSLKNKLKEKR